MPARYAFLVETYATEIDKVLGLWSTAEDGDLPLRPDPSDARSRNLLEHMLHQCLGEDAWFRTMLGIEVASAVAPVPESRLGFIGCYAACAAERLQHLREREEAWWEETVPFFETRRSRAWIVVRRIAHTAHHRGQQTLLLRALGRRLYSTYGPTADTGGLPRDGAAVVYPYPDVATLLEQEGGPRQKRPLPPPAGRAVTERPAPPVQDRGDRGAAAPGGGPGRT